MESVQPSSSSTIYLKPAIERPFSKVAQLFQLTLDENTSLKQQQEVCFNGVLEACRAGKWQLLSTNHNDLIQITDTVGRSLLLHILQAGERELAEQLIQEALFVHAVDNEGNTPLHIACSSGDPELIVKLLKHNSIHTRNKNGETPLHVAVEAGQPDAVLTLLENGAKADTSFTYQTLSVTPLAYAIIRGQLSCVEILAKRVGLDSATTTIGHILHLCVHFQQNEILAYLIKEHSSVCKTLLEQPNPKGLTPLAYAANLDNGPALVFLHTFGANLEAEDRMGYRPLHLAAKKQNLNVIEYLYYLGCQLSPTAPGQIRPIDLIKVESETGKSAKALLDNLMQLEKNRENRLPSFSFDPPENIVFKGGGPKGIAYLGALQALKKENALSQLKRVAGTSAGAINSAFLAFDFTVDEMLDLLSNTSLKSFLDARDDIDAKLHQDLKNLFEGSLDEKTLASFGKGQLHKTKAVWALIRRKPKEQIVSTLFGPIWRTTGLCKGEVCRNWIEDALSKKTGIAHCTFKELRTLIEQGKPYKHLHIFATKIDEPPRIVHFSSEDPQWDDIIISDAVRASMSIPVAFVPHTMHKKVNGERKPCPELGSFVDGGLLYNLPVEAFDQKGYMIEGLSDQERLCPIFNKRTLGFSLYDPKEKETHEPKKLETIADLAKALVSVYADAESHLRQMNAYNQCRVIEINNQGVGLLEFDLSKEKKEQLVKSGLDCTAAFFSKQTKTDSSTLFRIPRVLKEIEGVVSVKELHPHYIPRTALLTTLEKALVNRPAGTYILYGPGGVGKSELAIAFANSHLKDFSLVWSLSCGSEEEIIDGYRDLAFALKVPLDEKEKREKIIEKVHRKLEQNKGKPWLIIFDNLIKPRLLPARGGICLITAYEKKADVEGLEVGFLSEEEALQLLQKVTKQDSPHFKALVEHVGCYTLLLGQVAAYLARTQCDVKEYITLLQQGLPLQIAPSDRYQKTLETALTLTLKNLQPAALKWVTICAQLNPTHIPLSYLETYLTKEYPSELSRYPVLQEIKTALQDHALLRFEKETNSFSMHLELKKQILAICNPEVMEVAELLVQTKEKWTFENTKDWKKTMDVASIWALHALEIVGKEGGEGIPVKARTTLLTGLGTWEEESTHYKKAEEYHTRALELQRKEGDQHPDVAESLNNIGMCYHAEGKYDEALKNYQEALTIWKAVFKDKHPNVAMFLNGIGNCYYSQGKYGEALKNHQEALTIRKTVFGYKHPDVARSLNNIGNCYYSQGKYDEALKNYQEALTIWKAVFGDKHPYVAMSLNNIGSCYHAQGKYDAALKNHQEALTIQKAVFGDKHPNIAASLNHIGACYYSQGKYGEALKNHQEAITIRKAVFGDKHPDVALSLSNIGTCYKAQGEYDEALKNHQEALTTWKTVFGDKHGDVATALVYIGNCYYSQGKYDEALKTFQESLTVQKAVFGNEHPDVAASLSGIGACYKSQGKYDAALKNHQEALTIRKAVFGDKHPYVAMSLNNIGNCYLSKGNKFEARKFHQMAYDMAQQLLGDTHPNTRSYKRNHSQTDAKCNVQ